MSSKIISKFKKSWKTILLALGITVLLQVADYFITNATYPVLDNLDPLVVLDFVRKGEPKDSDILYIDVGLDKELVPVIDELGDTIGNTPISNRRLIADFLNLLKNINYTYIFIDLRFEKGTESNHDSILFSAMSNLDRFSFSTHRGMESLVPDSLSQHAAYSDFRGNYKDGFTRYEFFQSGKESSALRMYTTITGEKINKRGSIYLINGDLAYNMLFVPFYRNDAESLGEGGLEKYFNLGYELKNDNLRSEILKKAEGKIIVIGDFENDKHQTYMGEVPGPLITVRAYQILKKGNIKFSWTCFAIISFIYFLILFELLVNYNLNDKICNIIKIKSNGIAYLISFISWGFLLAVVKLTLYAIFGLAFVAWLPALVFSTISFVNGFRRFKE